MEVLESPPKTGGRFYYGWVIVALAAAAMVCTLPGRTIGLGLITEPLKKDLGLSGQSYEAMNFWATLIGALFGIGLGRLMDRVGSRIVLTFISVALGVSVLAMAGARSIGPLFIWITLTRGFGQAALSAISIAMVGIWFRRRLNAAMAVYAIVLSMGFMIAFPLVQSVAEKQGWRVAWAGVGWAILLGLAPAAMLLARRGPRGNETIVECFTEREETASGASLSAALKTAGFWIMGLASAVYGLIASGIAIYNQSVGDAAAKIRDAQERGVEGLAIYSYNSLSGGVRDLRRLTQVGMR